MDISWNLFLDALSQREEESAFFKLQWFGIWICFLQILNEQHQLWTSRDLVSLCIVTLPNSLHSFLLLNDTIVHRVCILFYLLVTLCECCFCTNYPSCSVFGDQNPFGLRMQILSDPNWWARTFYISLLMIFSSFCQIWQVNLIKQIDKFRQFSGY